MAAPQFNAMVYGRSEFLVPDDYIKMLLPHFYVNNIFQPGLNYTEYRTTAGAIDAYKGVDIAPKLVAPAGDFDPTPVKNELLRIPLDCSWRPNQKLFDQQQVSSPYDALKEAIASVGRTLRLGWEGAALTSLIAEGSLKSFKVAAIDKWSVKDALISWLATFSNTGASPTCVLCNPDFFVKLMQWAGTQYLPVTNEGLLKNFSTINLFNCVFINCPQLLNGNEKRLSPYVNFEGKGKKIADNAFKYLQCIIINPSSFAIATNFINAGLERGGPLGNFWMVMAEMTAGFRVTDADGVAVIATKWDSSNETKIADLITEANEYDIGTLTKANLDNAQEPTNYKKAKN
jgi:hypothetical protein